MIRFGSSAALTILCVAVAGCISYPLGPGSGIDPQSRQELATAVPLYDSSHPPSGNFISVGMITAYGCDNTFLGGPGRDEVLARLRQQAQVMGANGISDLSCEATDASALKGCLSATACSATALKIFAPEIKGD